MFWRSLFLGVLALMTSVVGSPSSLAEPQGVGRTTFKSPLGLAVDAKGERACVALHTAGTLAVVDLHAGKVLREIAVGKGPHDVALTKDTAWVTCADDDSLVAVALDRLTVRQRIPIGQAPCGVAVTPDGSRVYVACRDETLRWYETITGAVHACTSLPGVDRIRLTPDGKQLFFIPAHGMATGVLDARAPTPRIYQSPLLRDASNLRGLAVLTWGERSLPLVVHQNPKTHVPTTQTPQGWVFTNVLSPGALAGTRGAALDEVTRGYADPSDVVADSRHVFIASAGADGVLVLDTNKLLLYTEVRQLGETDLPPLDGSYTSYALLGENYHGGADLTASRHYVTARLVTQANPRRLALSGDGGTLVVSNSLADSLTLIDTATLKIMRHIPLGGPEPDAARRGEILFNSSKMTFQGQFTCASCHPNGEADGLNWDLTRDGVGNFKNTKSLLGVKDTAPFGWEGSSATLADRVTGTLRTLHHHEPAGTEVADLVAYLESLPPPRPLPRQEGDRPAIARGRDIFQDRGQCATCHHRAGLDDGKQHDVGTRGPGDTTGRFDTPALRGLARTAPYLHDGRAATLEEVFAKYDSEHRHGAAHILTKDELADLITYLKSL